MEALLCHRAAQWVRSTPKWSSPFKFSLFTGAIQHWRICSSISEGEGQDEITPTRKEKPSSPVPFFLSSTRNYLKIIVMSLSQPEHLEDMFNIQLGPAHCFSSEGGSPCPGVQSPLHTHKHKCITPQCCCPLSLPALPVGKAKPGSCQFQLRLGHVALLKKACW